MQFTPSSKKQQGFKMKIKVFIDYSTYKIINVSTSDDVRTIAATYDRWEYVL